MLLIFSFNYDLASTWLINVALLFVNHDLASQLRVNGRLSNVCFYRAV